MIVQSIANLSLDAKAAIIADAEARFPEESCGLLVAGKYVPCENLAEDPFMSFRIDAAQVLEASQAGTLEAVIHSHPNGPAWPTVTDMEQQLEGDVPWGIVSIDHKLPPDLFFWGDQLPIPPLEGRVFRHGIADCFALVRDWYRLNRDVVLPMTPRDGEWWNRGENVILDNLANFDFERVDDKPQIGDVILAQIHATTVNHTGIYVGNGLVLHHLQGRLSRKDVLGPWSKFVVQRMRQRVPA